MFRRAAACLLTLIAAGAAVPAAYAPGSDLLHDTRQEPLRPRRHVDIYFWYATMPNVKPTSYDSPEAYLEAVRYRTLDSNFSYITSRAANDAFYSDSQFIGFGLSTSLNDLEMRVTQVFPGQSGARSRPVARRSDCRDWRPAGGVAGRQRRNRTPHSAPSDIGVETNIAFSTRRAHATSAHGQAAGHDSDGVADEDLQRRRTPGRLHLLSQLRQPSFDALDAAFAELPAAGVDDLVLDLRYNGGGLVSVAQHLASYIGGKRTDGLVFAEYFHNDKNTFRNHIIRFEPKPQALTLDRLIVVTTGGSASASELVINALRPFIPVVVIGSRTYGKPVGQYGIEFCDKLLAPVSFALRNADGQGDFFDGFPPDCAAPDDADHQLGDPAEGSLKEALTFATTNACSARPLTPQTKATIQLRAPRAIGWQSLVNAY